MRNASVKCGSADDIDLLGYSFAVVLLLLTKTSSIQTLDWIHTLPTILPAFALPNALVPSIPRLSKAILSQSDISDILSYCFSTLRKQILRHVPQVGPLPYRMAEIIVVSKVLQVVWILLEMALELLACQ